MNKQQIISISYLTIKQLLKSTWEISQCSILEIMMELIDHSYNS